MEDWEAKDRKNIGELKEFSLTVITDMDQGQRNDSIDLRPLQLKVAHIAGQQAQLLGTRSLINVPIEVLESNGVL